MGISPAKFSSAGQSTSHYIPGNYSRRDVVGAGTGGLYREPLCHRYVDGR